MLYCSTDPARRRREKFWGFRTLFERFPKENQRFEAIILKNFASGGRIPKQKTMVKFQISKSQISEGSKTRGRGFPNGVFSKKFQRLE